MTNLIRIPKTKLKKKGCNVIIIPKEVCSIKFKKDKYDHTLDSSKFLINNYGDMMFIPVNKKREVIEIELAGTRKPCQK